MPVFRNGDLLWTLLASSRLMVDDLLSKCAPIFNRVRPSMKFSRRESVGWLASDS